MKTSNKFVCIILGGGGHASVLIDCIQMTAASTPLAILDRDRSRWGQELMGIPIRGGDELLPELVKEGANCFVVAVGATGDNQPRKHLYELALSYDLEPLTVIHPTATCSRWTTVGSGSQIFPGSIVNAGASLGANVIINSGAIVEHGCVLGDHVHLASGARLSSTVKVEECAHIGAGATVREVLTVGQGAVVGAGAVVVKDVLPDTVVVGVPARPLRG